MAEQLDDDPRADQAERDARRDAEGDPAAGRDPGHRDPLDTGDGQPRRRDPMHDHAAGIDDLPEAGGAAAPASGRTDAGPAGRLP